MITISQIARDAASIIKTRGWHRDDLYPGAADRSLQFTDASPVCASAALRLAAHPDCDPVDTGVTPAEEDLAAWLVHIGTVDLDLAVTPREAAVYLWNDKLVASHIEVLAALHAFANTVAELEPAGGAS